MKLFKYNFSIEIEIGSLYSTLACVLMSMISCIVFASAMIFAHFYFEYEYMHANCNNKQYSLNLTSKGSKKLMLLLVLLDFMHMRTYIHSVYYTHSQICRYELRKKNTNFKNLNCTVSTFYFYMYVFSSKCNEINNFQIDRKKNTKKEIILNW